jgi:hypothetical protein
MFDSTKDNSLKIIRNSDVTVNFEFEIYPLNVRHLIELHELFNEEDFFALGGRSHKSFAMENLCGRV